MNRWDIIGHDWAVELLHAAIQNGRVGHAYLITGLAQVGKTALALAFARTLNCQSEFMENRPCGVCRSCRLITSGRHPDVRVVEPEMSSRGNATLKIDQIRELQKNLNLAAYEGRYKIAILSQFDAANASAANAFLKTLEEPPSNVILILTASESDSMLPTINSRCRTLTLRPLPALLIQHALEEKFELLPQRAALLAHLANGRIGWAIQAAQDKAILEERNEQISLLHSALAGTRVNRFDLADRLSRKPEALPPLLQTWLGWWRDLNLLANGRDVEDALINIDEQENLHTFVAQWPSEQVLASLKQTHAALWQLQYNGNVRLVLENLFLKYPLPA